MQGTAVRNPAGMRFNTLDQKTDTTSETSFKEVYYISTGQLSLLQVQWEYSIRSDDYVLLTIKLFTESEVFIRENLNPTPSRIERTIARSMRQGRGLKCPYGQKVI